MDFEKIESLPGFEPFHHNLGLTIRPAPEAWHVSFWLSGPLCCLPLCFHQLRQVGKQELFVDRCPLAQDMDFGVN